MGRSGMAASRRFTPAPAWITDATGRGCFEFAQLITPRHVVRYREFAATSFTPR
jgi:hypothetical protein